MEKSLIAVFHTLGIELKELKDWNCCGATFYMSADETQSTVLGARNLTLAHEQSCHELMVPCPACLLVLEKTRRSLKTYESLRSHVEASLKTGGITLPHENGVKLKHPLDILINEIGIETIQAHVKYPLKGLRVAPYYGCQLLRPWTMIPDDPYEPVLLENLLESIGAEVVEYPVKTRCCGGSLTGTIAHAGSRLSEIIIHEAQRRKADGIATLCPLCQFNLEITSAPQSMAVFSFSQLLGLAFGLSPKKLGLRNNLAPAKSVVQKIQAEVQG